MIAPLDVKQRSRALTVASPEAGEKLGRVASHVALVFPGGSYGADRPLLRYPALVLAAMGAQARVVEYPDTTDAPEDEKWRLFDDAVQRTVESLVLGATRVTLLAKSLGTSAIAALDADVLPPDTSAVWITPLFGEQDIAEAAASQPWRSLYVFGTADRYHDAAGQSLVSARTGGSELTIEGADHALEVADDPVASCEALLQITRAVRDFEDRS